jgi:hypothetical protein
MILRPLYVQWIGGIKTPDATKEMTILRLGANEWEPSDKLPKLTYARHDALLISTPPLPPVIAGAPTVVAAAGTGVGSIDHTGDHVFVVGGDSSSFFKSGSSSERFDGRQWTLGSTTHMTRGDMTLTYSSVADKKDTSATPWGITPLKFTPKIWVCSGVGSAHGSSIPAVEILDTHGMESTSASTRIAAHLNHNNRTQQCIVAVGNTIVVCGGYDGSKYYDIVERLNPSTSKWEIASWSLPFPSQRWFTAHYIADTFDNNNEVRRSVGVAATKESGRLILIGSSSMWWTELSDNGRVMIGSWQQIPSLPVSCTHVTSVLIP